MNGSHPVAYGSINIAAAGWLDAAYDLDAYQSTSNETPVVVVVSARQLTTKQMLAVVELADPFTGVFHPTPSDWKLLGSVHLPPAVQQPPPPRMDAPTVAARGGAGAGRGGAGVPHTGCNRVRVHHRSKLAIFSCFGGGAGNDVVGFVDLTDTSTPKMLGTVPFVTQQPTGMLVVGDAVFVAGELDIMVFNLRGGGAAGMRSAHAPLPPLVATCGAACTQVGTAHGQNFHSLAYRLQEGRHLLFISAQIDNNIGCVEIVDPNVIALLAAE